MLLNAGGETIELEKENQKVLGKDRWETLDVIQLLPLVGLNNRQPILNMSKRMVHCYYIYESINQFEVGYMVNPSLNFDKLSRKQVEICLSATFHEKTI